MEVKVTYDDVLKKIGDFGRYQKIQYFLVCLVSITSAMHSLNMVFVGPTPAHQCNQPFIPPQWANLTPSEQERLTYPLVKDGDSGKISACQMYDVNDTDWTVGGYTEWMAQNRTPHDCLYGWTYSKEYYTTTIVSEVCALQLPHKYNRVKGY